MYHSNPRKTVTVSVEASFTVSEHTPQAWWQINILFELSLWFTVTISFTFSVSMYVSFIDCQVWGCMQLLTPTTFAKQ